jgi:hypothetical protein
MADRSLSDFEYGESINDGCSYFDRLFDSEYNLEVNEDN